MRLRPLASARGAAQAGAIVAILAAALPARGQSDGAGEAPNGPASVVSCTEINNRAMEATLVVRQHMSQLSLGFGSDARAQAMVMLAWLDQWAGRLRGFLDLGESTGCVDEGDAETYRRALASATRVANQARDELLRLARAPQPQNEQQRFRRP